MYAKGEKEGGLEGEKEGVAASVAASLRYCASCARARWTWKTPSTTSRYPRRSARPTARCQRCSWTCGLSTACFFAA